jgi:hypothetical protein
MLKKITGQKLVSILCVISLIFVVGGLVWFAVVSYSIAGPLVLHFNSVVGVTQVGDFGMVVGVGFLAVLIVLLNSIIAVELAARDRFLGIFTAGTNLAFAVLLFIATAAIISVN